MAIFIGNVFAQNVDELNKLRVAQALEQAGDFDKALPFYKQLYDAHPDNYIYFDDLRRTYISLRDYSAAADLIRSRLAISPNDVVLLSQLGDLYYKEGKPDSAGIVWNNALEVNPKDINAYRFVAQTMVNDNLYDRAVEVYKEGEEKTGSETAFVTDIAHVYFLNLNYRGSITELLKLFDSKNNESAYSYVESQLAQYSSSKEAMSSFTSVMEEKIKNNSGSIPYRQLLAFLYMQQKDYTSAYSVYKWLDDRLRSGGSEILAFADRAFDDGAYRPAAAAYKEVSESAKVSALVVRALMGYANSLRSIGVRDYSDEDMPCSSNDSLTDLNASLSTYRRIVTDFGNTDYAGPAAMNSIDIEMNYLHDYAEAERLFSKYRGLLDSYGEGLSLLRARLYIKEGNFKASLLESQRILTRADEADDPYYNQVQYEAAISLYCLGMFDSSTYYLKRISANPSSDAADDAIRLYNLISDNKGNSGALNEYASAQAMEMSNRVPEEAATLEDILKKYPSVPLTDNTVFDLAAAYCKMGNVKQSLEFYSRLAADSTGIFADKAQFRIGRIYQETLHDKQKAISEYESFLARFPNSIYQNRVRQILQELLGPNS